jgi:hypothetical protein
LGHDEGEQGKVDRTQRVRRRPRTRKGDKPDTGGATSLESRMRQKVPVRFGNWWLEKYCPAILQEGLCLKKAENITA